MSKTSYVLIGVMIAAIAWMAGLRGYQAYEAYTAKQEEENTSVFSFQNVPRKLDAPVAEPVTRPVAYPSASKEIYLTDEPLPPALETEQAKQTVKSILADYGQEDAFRRFGRELSQATNGEITGLGSLSGPEVARLVQKYPQVTKIIAKNMQDPQFAAMVKDVFSNPQYVQSIAVLQGRAAAGKAPRRTGGKN